MRKSFTVIELVMVMVIIGVLSVISMPVIITSYSSIKIDGAYKQLKQDIRYAQQLAVSRQVVHGIYLDPSADSYFVYRLNTSNIVKDPSTQKPLNVIYGQGKFSGVDMVSTTFNIPANNTLEFNSLGAPSCAGTITLRYGSITKTVDVEQNTGRIQ